MCHESERPELTCDSLANNLQMINERFSMLTIVRALHHKSQSPSSAIDHFNKVEKLYKHACDGIKNCAKKNPRFSPSILHFPFRSPVDIPGTCQGELRFEPLFFPLFSTIKTIKFHLVGLNSSYVTVVSFSRTDTRIDLPISLRRDGVYTRRDVHVHTLDGKEEVRSEKSYKLLISFYYSCVTSLRALERQRNAVAEVFVCSATPNMRR